VQYKYAKKPPHLYETSPASLPVFRFFFAEPLLGNVLLDPGPVAFSLFFHRFSMSVFLIKWKYIVTERWFPWVDVRVLYTTL
jgi:hypothetical protein